MNKIAFIVPWHGENIPGGAEAALRSITEHLDQAGVPIEILTTCVEKFTADWSMNYYKPGEYKVNGILTRRFKVRKRDTELFDSINAKLLEDKMVSDVEEKQFMQEMVNSPSLYEYMKAHEDEYALFVFIPYLFGTTYYGAQICPKKTVLIPCAHEESYIHMRIFKEVFEHSRGMLFNAKPEQELVNQLFDMSNVLECTPGLGMDTNITSNAERFKGKYGITQPFILYAGRKDVGKNIYTLIQYYIEYRKRNEQKLKLVLIGGGDINLPEAYAEDIIDLGFVDSQDKYDACAAALCLCQPSLHESFSYVIMESWLCGRPVLVHEKCEVTKNFAIQANGGLYFSDYFEFEGAVNYIFENKKIAAQMGENGRSYVLKEFAWDIIVDKYMRFFNECIVTQED